MRNTGISFQLNQEDMKEGQSAGGNPFSFGNQKKRITKAVLKVHLLDPHSHNFRKVCLLQREESEVWRGQVSFRVSTPGILFCSLQTRGL